MEKEQKDEENDKYKAKLRYYKSSIEELVTKLDEYEAKNRISEEKIRNISTENLKIKEEFKFLSSENKKNKAKAQIYQKISSQLKQKFTENIKEICLEFRKEQNLLGKYINESLYGTFVFLSESIKEILKKIQLFKRKYKGIKENLEEKINKLQENLALILEKFEGVKGNFDNEFEEKIKEIQRLKEDSNDYERKFESLWKENEILRGNLDEKEKELYRNCNEKKKLMNEALENEIKYKKLYTGFEEEIEKNRNLLKEIRNFDELLTKKNGNENIKAELFKKIKKITKNL